MIPAIVFFICGLGAVISQTVLLRELLVVFQGNELTLGVLLSQWLLGTALGSWLAGRRAWQRRLPAGPGLLLPILAAALWFPAAILIARLWREGLGVLPGQGLGLGQAWLAGTALLLPQAVLTGLQFSAGVRWLDTRQSEGSGARVYVWEALGYALGGVVFTFVLASGPGSLATAGWLAAVSGLAAALVAQPRQGRWPALALALLLAAMTLAWARPLESWSLGRQHRGWDLRAVQNSPYSRLAVADRKGERTFLFQGQPGLTLPYPDLEQAEIFTGIPWLCQPAPRRVLLLGGSGAFLPELLEHPLSALTYVELDPWFLKLLERYWLPEPATLFRDPRLEIRPEDGRRFLAETRERFDLIYAAAPFPLTLGQNRYFTREFFEQARAVLAPSGWLALALPGSLVYLDPDWAELLSIIRATLQDVFPNVWLLPGETNLLLAWQGQAWPTPDELRQRLLDSPVRYQLLSPAYLAYRLDPEKQVWLEDQLSRAEGDGRSNEDYRPTALVAGLLHWQAVFAPGAGRFYHRLRRYLWLLWPLLLGWLLLGRAEPRATAAASGCTAMGLQMLSLWSLQTASGALYGWLGLLSGLFMAGAALGAFAGRSGAKRFPLVSALLASEALFAFWIAAWWLVLRLHGLNTPACLLFSAGSGWLLGAQFPLLAGRASGSGAAGIYAADALGGWLAAGLVGSLLIPVWGWELTLLALGAVKLATLKGWVLAEVERKLSAG
ncbi:MAG: hypothetical protein AB1439_12255 [candidate division FCPU426 bacterium]